MHTSTASNLHVSVSFVASTSARATSIAVFTIKTLALVASRKRNGFQEARLFSQELKTLMKSYEYPRLDSTRETRRAWDEQKCLESVRTHVVLVDFGLEHEVVK